MTTEMELKMVKNEYNIPTEQLEYYKNEIMELLPMYRYQSDKHYAPTEKGVNALLEIYNKEKGWMYPYFMSHPNYIGNGKIAFSSDYHRKINAKGVQDFIAWIYNKTIEIFTKTHEVRINGMTYDEAREAFRHLNDIIDLMQAIKIIPIGQANTSSVRVNGLTFMEMVMERDRIDKILNSLKNNYVEKYTNYETYYITKENADILDNLLAFLRAIHNNPHMFVIEEEVKEMNLLTESLDLRISKGLKMSKAIGRFCKAMGIDKLDGYQQKFAKLGDDINELDIKRHTIISINPIDYFTMSFGNSWSSCHTIDKMNDRNSSDSHYHGQYSGGTLSYMLDGSSIVFYTVDKKYNGTIFELQPKVNRCMFHLGEDKLIQGRVYPQANDGDQTIYDEIRAIMQKVVSEIFNVNNLWINKKGTITCSSVTLTKGSHYPDYTNFNTCNVSWLKPEEEKQKNNNLVIIGHKGVCPTCGRTHNNSSFIICTDCKNEVKRCPHCGRRVSEDDHIEIDGQVYCSYCAKWCDHHQRWEIDTQMIRIHENPRMVKWNRRSVDLLYNYTERYICTEALENNPDKYKRDVFSGKVFDTRVTEGIAISYYTSIGWSCCKEYAEYKGYKEAYNGIWYHKDFLNYDRHAEVKAYIPNSEWNYTLNCWVGIEDKVREYNEQMAQREARRIAREARRNAENAA